MIPTCTDIESERTWCCKVCTTSLAVNSPQPKCHWTPLRRLKVHVLPSGLMLQSVASIGTKWCHGSSSTKASYTGAYWAAKMTVMSTGSFCSRSNCTATFRRSTWGGVADGVGVGAGVCAGAEPLRVSNLTTRAIPHLSKGCCLMTAHLIVVHVPSYQATGRALSERNVMLGWYSSSSVSPYKVGKRSTRALKAS